MRSIFEKVGENIRFMRQMQGISVEEAAWQADIDPAYWSSIERGGRNITLLTLHIIADAMHIETYELLMQPHQLKEKYHCHSRKASNK